MARRQLNLTAFGLCLGIVGVVGKAFVDHRPDDRSSHRTAGSFPGHRRTGMEEGRRRHVGEDIPGVPNKRGGGICIGGKVAPIFYNTMEDAGALPIEMDVSQMNMGDVIDVYPYEGHGPAAHVDAIAGDAELVLPAQVQLERALEEEARQRGLEIETLRGEQHERVASTASDEKR